MYDYPADLAAPQIEEILVDLKNDGASVKCISAKGVYVVMCWVLFSNAARFKSWFESLRRGMETQVPAMLRNLHATHFYLTHLSACRQIDERPCHL